MFDWDDLRIFLAAARTRSLAEAARKLSIDAATVGRRLSRLEAALKSTLFTRSKAGLKLTAAGNRLLETALRAETAMEQVNRTGERDVGGGTVRLSVAEGFGTAVVAPALPAFREARKHLRIELAAQTAFLAADKREADIAVTLAPTMSSQVVVEPLGDYALGLFASPAYLARNKPPESAAALKGHEIVGYVDDLLHTPELRYMDEILPGLQPSLSSSSIRAQGEIVRAGGGVGVLPFFLARGLTRVLPGKITLMRRLWLNVHQAAAGAARVRLVQAWLKQLVKDNARLLTKFP